MRVTFGGKQSIAEKIRKCFSDSRRFREDVNMRENIVQSGRINGEETLGAESNTVPDSRPVFVCPYVMGDARGRFDESGNDTPEPVIRRWTFVRHQRRDKLMVG